MTLSILENELLENETKRVRKMIKITLHYVLITIFCVVFGWIYEQFSHDVFSAWMSYFFLIPLVGGVLPFILLLRSRKLLEPDGWSLMFYHSGIATLAVGSCFKGVLEIYGTDSSYSSWYLCIGSLLVVIGVVKYIWLSREASV